MERKMKDTEVKMREMEWRLIDQEARSRRNNLLFFGVAEKDGEHCHDVIYDIIGKQLALEPKDMSTPKTYRLGPPQRRNVVGKAALRPRPIIACFSNAHDRERVWSARHKLSRPLGIGEDLPVEIKKARESLLPELKELKNRKKKAAIVYPAKLVSDGKVVNEVKVIDFLYKNR